MMSSRHPRNFVLAFSGGLDTSYCLALLVDRGERVTTVTVNTGGFDDAELRDIETRSHALGADEHVVIDGRARHCNPQPDLGRNLLPPGRRGGAGHRRLRQCLLSVHQCQRVECDGDMAGP